MHMDGMKLTRRVSGHDHGPRSRSPSRSGGVSGCSGFSGTTAASFLRSIEESPDPNPRYEAYDKLARPNCYDSEQQKAEAARVLSGSSRPGKSRWRPAP